MNTIETPLRLSLLISAYIGDRKTTSDACCQYFMEMERAGLVKLNHYNCWQTTEKGDFFMKALLKVPLPQSHFIIPHS